MAEIVGKTTSCLNTRVLIFYFQQTAYPLPKNIILEDVEKRLFKKVKKNLARKNKEEGKYLPAGSSISCEEVKITEF